MSGDQFGELDNGFSEELTFGPSLEDKLKSLPDEEARGMGGMRSERDRCELSP